MIEGAVLYIGVMSYRIDRFVGIPKEYVQDGGEVLSRALQEKGALELAPYEIEMTRIDWEIFNLAEGYIRSIVERCGKTYHFFPHANIHIVRPGGTHEFTRGKLSHGGYSLKEMTFMADRSPSNVNFALTIFHELVHASSYRALQLILGKQSSSANLVAYRSGFSVTSRDGSISYFKDIEEAVIGILTERFYLNVVFTHPLFATERQQMMREGLRPDTSREEEAAKLRSLAKDLYSKNRALFSGEDDVIDLFISGNVTGNLMPAARLVEQSYGKGSFRTLGENTSRREKVE